MEIPPSNDLAQVIELQWPLMDAPELHYAMGQFKQRRCPQLRADQPRRVAFSLYHLERSIDVTAALNWHVELDARAAARAHFWLEEEHPATIHESIILAGYEPSRRIPLVNRSQILRAIEPLIPGDLEKYLNDTEQMVRRWQPTSQPVPYLLYLDTARGMMQFLRPPDTEAESIRAPPQCPEESYADANSAKDEHEDEHRYPASVPIPGSTNKQCDNLSVGGDLSTVAGTASPESWTVSAWDAKAPCKEQIHICSRGWPL